MVTGSYEAKIRLGVIGCEHYGRLAHAAEAGIDPYAHSNR